MKYGFDVMEVHSAHRPSSRKPGWVAHMGAGNE